ncbi:tRNA pseudouridine(38-40) synthase TruA [Bacteriovoracaceae bacterium]|nr:tRNA pseudouridine(38-40) synthase TruA [Bacteriovoracaceae bacterium]
MFNYIMRTQYEGTRYFGWQIQKELPTIQGEINRILEKLTCSDQIYSIGSSRTDAGVHCLDQVVKVSLPVEFCAKKLEYAMNGLLPKDIRVSSIITCEESFHPLRHVETKEYAYYFHDSRYNPVIANNFVAKYPYRDLDFGLLKDACNALIGKWDFKNFYCTGSVVHSTHREILSCSIGIENQSLPLKLCLPEVIVFKIEGTGFLKQMVRLIMGSLWAIATKKKELFELKDALSGELPSGRKLGVVAPAKGLFLTKTNISY